MADTTSISVETVKPFDTLIVAGRIYMQVIGVKANDYGVEEGVTLYVKGSDGLTDSYSFETGTPVEVIRA